VLCAAQDAWQGASSQPGITIVRPAPQTDEDLSSILADKPEVPITAPNSPPPKQEAKLPFEHTMVINRLCRLEHRPSLNWVVLRFLSEPGKPAEADRYALPNQRLTDMEEIVANAPQTVFLVSGESLTYKGRPYLMVRLALEQVMPTAAARAAMARPTSLPAAAASGPASAPASRAAADPDDLIRKLLEERPGKPILTQSDIDARVEPMPSVSPAVAKQLPQAYGTVVVDRIVHLVGEQEGGWWIVRFLADNTLQEQPIRLLPCQLLSRAELMADTKTGRTVKLRVSGEITRYKGKEYLLLRKVLRERDMNQF
jgi:hypothetical protein